MQKIIDGIRKGLELMVFSIFAVIIVLTIIQVLMRYVFRDPITWYDEFVRFLLIWGTLLGCGLATHYRKHIGMDLLLIKLPKKGQDVLTIIIHALIIILCVFYFFKGTAIAVDNLNVQLPTTHISKMFYYGAIPVGALFWLIYSFEAILNVIRPCGSKEGV